MKICPPPKFIQLINNDNMEKNTNSKSGNSFDKMLKNKLTEEDEIGIIIEHMKKRNTALRALCMQAESNRKLSDKEKMQLRKKYDFSNMHAGNDQYKDFVNDLSEMGLISAPPIVDGYILTNIRINESFGCIEGDWTKVGPSSMDRLSKSDGIENINFQEIYYRIMKNLEKNYENIMRLGIYKNDPKSEIIRRQYESQQTILKIINELA